MQAILNPPVVAHGPGEALGIRREAAEVEALFYRSLACQRARGFHHPDTAQPRPVLPCSQVCALLRNPIAAALFAAMALLMLFRVSTGGAVGVRLWPRGQVLLHGLRQRGLITLERQDIVRVALYNLLGNGPLTAHGVNGHNTSLEGPQLQ